jgi:hypothetical protein
MKYIKYYSIFLFTLFIFVGCEDKLDTQPSDKASGTIVFSTVENAYVALNGIYRNFYTVDQDKIKWSENYGAESFGVAANQLAFDLMGEDMVQNEAGSSWFWYDYKYWVRAEINNQSDRPFVWWNQYYQYINNANNILAAIDAAPGDPEDRNDIKGQAFALRGFCYFYLVQLYQRTYVGHENDPGVPIYTEPTTPETEGNPRGTVEAVYTQIHNDLDSAIIYLAEAPARRHKSHIDLAVANGIKARVALVQNDWSVAAQHARSDRTATSVEKMNAADLLSGFNSVSSSGWLWGSEINEDQATIWSSFFSHMDSRVSASYANGSRKCIASWLYGQIGDNDIRKDWFYGSDGGNQGTGTEIRYNQFKFGVKTPGSWASDYIYMRMAEMYLIEAEAECRQENYTNARNLLTEIIGYKDPDYATKLAGIPDGRTLNLGSGGPVINLLDEIILQRRIEMWGEGLRIFDIMRLKTGFDRTAAGGNHPDNLAISDPESWEWIMMIPQKEFDANQNMNSIDDQNP